MDKQLEERLKGLEEQLKRFVDVLEQGLGRDLARPIKAVRDGYYEAALTNAGSIIEAMLRDIWQREGIKGEGKKKTIEQLFSVVKEQAQMDRLVQDYIRDIQLVRNRAAHGEDIVIEDSLEALRKLAVILEWYFSKYVTEAPNEAPPPCTDTLTTPAGRDRVSRAGSLLRRSLTAAVAIMMLAVGWTQWHRVSPSERSPGTPGREGCVVAVSPFYGPDAESAREGRVMAALVEKEIREVLAQENVEVLGIEATVETVRDHDAARELGRRLGASVVVWGEAFALHGETEIEPSFTMASKPRTGGEAGTARKGAILGRRPAGADAPVMIGDRQAAAVNLSARAPNQIELRRRSASEIGEVVRLLAAAHLLGQEDAPERALRLLEELPSTADTLLLEARALIQLGRIEQAQGVAAEATKLEPDNADALALSGDLHVDAHRWTEAFEAYRRAARTSGRFTSTRGTAVGDSLLIGEAFASERLTRGRTFQTVYLLELDPETGTTTRRHPLPGHLLSMTTTDDAVEVHYAVDYRWWDEIPSDTAVVRWTTEGLDADVAAIPDPVSRLRTIQSGLRLAGNFLSDLDRPADEPFGLVAHPAPDVPTDLVTLEAELRSAIAADPTQPFHRFFLGQTLWSQGQNTQAEEVWAALSTEDFQTTTYNEFAWMATQFELWGNLGWADRLYAAASERRARLAQPVLGYAEPSDTTGMWRLMMPRTEAAEDVGRALVWRQRVRDLFGIELNGIAEILESFWFRRFRTEGEQESAAESAALLKSMQPNPFNINRYRAYLDIGILLLLVSFPVLIAVVAVVFVRAATREQTTANFVPESVWSRAWLRFGSLGFAEKAVVLAVAISALSMFRVVMPALTVTTLVVLLALLLRQRGQRLTRIVGSMSAQEVAALALVSLLFLCSMAGFSLVRDQGSWLQYALNITDGLGSARALDYFEGRLDNNDLPATRYVAGVVAQMAGRLERARQIYGPIERSDRRVRPNLERLDDGGGIAPGSLTLRDLWRADVARPWRSQLASLRLDEIALGVVFLAVMAMLIATPWALRRESNATPGFLLWSSYLLVPGAFDLRRRSAVLGTVALSLFVFTVVAAVTGIFAWPMTGVASRSSPLYGDAAWWWPATVLQPEIVESVGLSFEWSLFSALPGGKELWIAAIVCALVALTLHLRRLPAIIRLRRREDVAGEPERHQDGGAPAQEV